MAETLSILAFEHKSNMEASIYNEATNALILFSVFILKNVFLVNVTQQQEVEVTFSILETIHVFWKDIDSSINWSTMIQHM